MIHFHHPRELDYYALDREDARANVNLAFEVLKTRWGIPALVEPSSLLSGHVDDNMLLTLLATLKKELREPPTHGQSRGSAAASAEDDSLYHDDFGGHALESRDLLRRVVDHASAGERPETDAALAKVLELFRGVI